jgi:hypothetical protein
MGETTVTGAAKPQVRTFGRNGLSPGAYTLDLSAVADVPVKANGQSSSFADVYCKLRDSKIEQMPQLLQLFSERYVTAEGVVELKCDWPLKATLLTLNSSVRV